MATTQDNFRKELARRYRALRGALRETIVANDALDLPVTPPTDRERSGGAPSPRAILQQNDDVDPSDAVDAATAFEFTTRSRAEAFQEWWSEAVERGLLAPIDHKRVGNGEHYSAAFIENAYEKGLRWAESRAKLHGGIATETPGVIALARRPAHKEALRTLYTRTYGQLKTASSSAENDIARILTEEMAKGENSRDIGDTLTGELRSMQRTDGRRIARTEVMNAHSTATGTRYQELGVEWATIVTSDPCELCIALKAGAPYKVGVLVSNLPRHPNCVCSMVPAEEPTGS